jgi:hypothetical protein
MGLCSFLHFGMMSGTSSKAVSENNQAQPYIHTDEALRIFQYTHIRMIYKKTAGCSPEWHSGGLIFNN